MKYIKSVGIKNFFSYGPQESVIDLTGSGLVNISGKNGVGKSTILEAMIFALYGKTRQEKIADVVNRNVGKDCKVSVEFVGDDDEIYKVIRYRSHSTHGDKAYLFKGDKDISCKNASDTNELIVDTFGMPFIAFVNSTVFSSEFYSNFLAAKNSDRLTIFENILSLKEVSYFYAEVKTILKELADRETEMKVKFAEVSSKESFAKETIDNYTSQAKEKLLELKSEKDSLKEIVKKLEKEIEELEELDVAKEKAKLSNNTLKEEYQKQVNDKTEALSELFIKEPDEKKVYDEYKDFDFSLNKQKEEEYNKKKEENEKLRIKKTEEEKLLSDMKNSLISLNEKINSVDVKQGVVDEKRNTLRKEEEKLDSELESIKSAVCPYCGQTMGEKETEEKRKAVSEKIIELRKKEEVLTEEKKELLELKNEYNNTLEKEKEKILKQKNIVDSIVIEELKKDFVENSALLEEKFNNAKKIYEDYLSKKESNSIKEDKLKEEILSLKEKINQLEISPYTEEYLNSIEEKIKTKSKEIVDSNYKITAIDGTVKSVYDKNYVEKMKSDLEEISKQKEVISKLKEEIEDDIKHYEYLGECCSNKSGGFKKFFIGEMIPVFNDKINQFLPFFFGDRKIEISFDKDLNDTIKSDGKEITFASLSCGQKTRAEVAAAFALFGLSRIFFSNQSGLLVVDELLDRGLDEIGIKSAISVLESFAEDSKVYVISHNPIVKENINDVIEIKADENGFSYIKE